MTAAITPEAALAALIDLDVITRLHYSGRHWAPIVRFTCCGVSVRLHAQARENADCSEETYAHILGQVDAVHRLAISIKGRTTLDKVSKLRAALETRASAPAA